jgi:hypothetical protein
MVRGRTIASAGMVVGDEITGEVIELGSDSTKGVAKKFVIDPHNLLNAAA